MSCQVAHKYSNTFFGTGMSLPQNMTYISAVSPVTNYHILGGLKQQKFILSPFWRPEVQHKSNFQKGQMYAKGTKRKPTACLSYLLVTAGMSWCWLALSANTLIFTSVLTSSYPLQVSQVCVKSLSWMFRTLIIGFRTSEVITRIIFSPSFSLLNSLAFLGSSSSHDLNYLF